MSAAHRERGDARAVESERESVGSLGLWEKGVGRALEGASRTERVARWLLCFAAGLGNWAAVGSGLGRKEGLGCLRFSWVGF